MGGRGREGRDGEGRGGMGRRGGMGKRGIGPPTFWLLPPPMKPIANERAPMQ